MTRGFQPANDSVRNVLHLTNRMVRRLRVITHLSVLIVATAINVVGWQANAIAQTSLPRVGVLTIVSETKEPVADWMKISRRSLAQQGWIDGKTVTLVMRDAQGDPSKFRAAAEELVNQKVDVIYATGAPAIRAAYELTKSIPIIGSDYTNDPVAIGYAKSYGRPGGNVTGVFLDAPQFAAKWLEMMREIVPDLKRVAALWDPSPGDNHVRALTSIAKSMGLQLQVVQVHKPEDIDRAGDAFTIRPQAVVILPSAMLYVENARLVSLATRLRLPFTSIFPRFAEAGGLLGYGPNDSWTTERMAIMVGKVLRGTKPGDLPIERPLTFDLVVNLKTAKELNIKLPESILVRAERVIR